MLIENINIGSITPAPEPGYLSSADGHVTQNTGQSSGTSLLSRFTDRRYLCGKDKE